jgi:hypothetical protein
MSIELRAPEDADEIVTLLEALASDVAPTGVNMSNQTTPTAGDADDQ